LSVGEILACATPGDAAEYLAMRLDYGPANGSVRLREAISSACGGRAGDVVVTHGALEALVLACAASIGDRKLVAVAAPGYEGLFRAVEVSGGVCRAVTVWRPGTTLLDLGGLRRLNLAHVGAVVVNSPHNPTGLRAELAELADLASHCERAGTTLIVDQVSLGTLDPEAESACRLPGASSKTTPVVWIGDVSKSLGLGGLRVGWCATANTALRSRITALRDTLTLSNATPCQHLAAIALEHRASFGVSVLAQRNRTRLGQLIAAVPGASWTAPVDGLVAFPRLPMRQPSRPFADRLRANRGVSVAPGAFFGHDRHLRLGLGVAADTFNGALDHLSEALGGPGYPVGDGSSSRAQSRERATARRQPS
jgi:aspartate/methionine/tyrosine aminotransferase